MFYMLIGVVVIQLYAFAHRTVHHWKWSILLYVNHNSIKKKKKTWAVESPAWERTSAPALPPVWPWTSYLSFLSLGFITCPQGFNSSYFAGLLPGFGESCSTWHQLSTGSLYDRPAESHSVKCLPRWSWYQSALHATTPGLLPPVLCPTWIPGEKLMPSPEDSGKQSGLS